jgi:hypothetical protein
MTETALEQRGTPLDKRGETSSGWVKRTVLVTFCVVLLGTLCLAFTRVIAARVPEQRATLEKLITDRTGLAVRFDNVHFAWNLDGTSAVFERVELTDPKRGRVRVVAPELRVEFDTWDYLRHHQFSLGHVTLSSPDIEIVGEPEETIVAANAPRGSNASRDAQVVKDDEAALIRRFTAWAELMPNGRVEVEGARVHLIRRGTVTGKGAAHTSFTLSQAVLSRGATSFNAFGTMLLSQDVGQSLFLSAKLEGLGSPTRVSGDLRVIARRVLLERVPLLAAKGRGTLDATVRLKKGLIHSATWQASARELELGNAAHARFDHLTVTGKLERDAGDFLLNFADLQLTRGARLERSPNVVARLRMEPGSRHVARTTLTADRVPFMAAELIAGVFAPQLDDRLLTLPGGWTPTAGVLRALRFDSQARTFSAQLSGAELVRSSDHARIGQLAARVHADEHELRLEFDPAEPATLRLTDQSEPRAFKLSGELAVLDQPLPGFLFESFDVRTGDSAVTAQGEWNTSSKPLDLTVAKVDRALLRDAWTLLAPEHETPALLADVESGNVVEGKATLLPTLDANGQRMVNWQRSSGTLKLDALATSGKEWPRLESGGGALAFARSGTRLTLDAGTLDQLSVMSARFDWPRKGEPRLRAALQGDLSSSLLRGALEAQGLERLAGSVTLEAEARGDAELRQPDLWRVNARITNASVPVGGGLPPLEKLAGLVRYGNGALRSLALEGHWLGGPLEIESRRASTRGVLNVIINGVADAAPLLRLLGQPEAASRVNGQLSWTGTAQRIAGNDKDGWQLAFTSNLAGIESRLPEPFDKARARLLPVNAQLRVDANGIRDFSVDGRDLAISGLIESGTTTARFELHGVAGELRRAGNTGEPQLRFERLDLKRAPAVLAVAGALMPADGEVDMTIDDMRHAGRSLGALQATLAQRTTGVAFSFESMESAPHQLVASGSCAGASGACRLEFTADTRNLSALLRGTQLPAEWPAESLHAAGELSWPADARGDLTSVLSGRFDLEAEGRHGTHQMSAIASVAAGQIQLTNVQGTGPDADQLFRGSGRVDLTERDYDFTIDYERVSLAASGVPTPARAPLARAWTALRGTAARRGWTEAPETRRVQWHGTWDAQD